MEGGKKKKIIPRKICETRRKVKKRGTREREMEEKEKTKL